MNGVVRLRARGWRWMLPTSAVLVAMSSATAVLTWLTPPRQPWHAVPMFAYAAFYVVSACLIAGASAKLSPSGYWGRRPFRRGLRLAWADVRGLHAQVIGRRTRIVATLNDGSTLPLPWPLASPWALNGTSTDAEWFAQQYRQVGEAWAAAQPADVH